MITRRLIVHSLRSMARFRMRSGFMMLGTFIGVAGLTLIVSVGGAAERKILSTVRATRGAMEEELVAGGRARLDEMLACGTTTAVPAAPAACAVVPPLPVPAAPPPPAAIPPLPAAAPPLPPFGMEPPGG